MTAAEVDTFDAIPEASLPGEPETTEFVSWSTTPTGRLSYGAAILTVSSRQRSQNSNLSSFRFCRCKPTTRYCRGEYGESSIFWLFREVNGCLYEAARTRPTQQENVYVQR
jgi:hypothetical protein